MPPFDLVKDALLYMVLPALVASAIVMAIVERLGGAKQAPAGAALGLIVGALLGLWLRTAGPMFVAGSTAAAFSSLSHSLTVTSSDSTWNRLPWAVLTALCLGRVTHMMDEYAGDGWLLRGGVAIAISWALIPEEFREQAYWLAPAFAAVMWMEWVILDRLAAQQGCSSVAIGLLLSLLAGAGVLIHAGAAGLTDTAAVLAFALVGILLVSLWRGSGWNGAIPAIAVALPGLLLIGQLTQAEEKIHWSAFALAGCAPLVLIVTLPFGVLPKPLLHLLRLALILIPLSVALYLASEAGPLEFGDEWK
jgi:hypothetical protein